MSDCKEKKDTHDRQSADQGGVKTDSQVCSGYPTKMGLTKHPDSLPKSKNTNDGNMLHV
jgi:hypothetical protein